MAGIASSAADLWMTSPALQPTCGLHCQPCSRLVAGIASPAADLWLALLALQPICGWHCLPCSRVVADIASTAATSLLTPRGPLYSGLYCHRIHRISPDCGEGSLKQFPLTYSIKLCFLLACALGGRVGAFVFSRRVGGFFLRN